MTEPVVIYQGDVRACLRRLPPESVHTVVTSVPYWGLRLYRTAPQLWGGDPLCAHAWETERTARPNGSGGRTEKQSTSPGSFVTDDRDRATYSQFCVGCGCWKGELGLEPTIALYVEHLVEVFREVWRVLRRDGTLWLNIGDCYASSVNGRRADGKHERDDRTFRDKPINTVVDGLKPKDLCGVPWRVAFALQADGWWLRSDIIWHKPNGMPSSVKDRPAGAHEYLFLLTRSESYFYDHESVREPNTAPKKKCGPNAMRGQAELRPRGNGTDTHRYHNPAGRNRRSVWTIPTQPCREEHFATFPERLVEPCILAGASGGGCCALCGAPLRPVVEKGEPDRDWQQACGGDAVGEYHGQARKDYAASGAQNASATKARILKSMVARHITGWERTCRCHPEMAGEPVPATVLDPFSGLATTGLVARRLGRHYIGCELQPAYVSLSCERLGEPVRVVEVP